MLSLRSTQSKITEPWDVGEYSDKGTRSLNEDVLLVEDGFASPEVSTPSLLVGIFDGHSGERCAKFLSEEIPNQLKNHRLFIEQPEVALREVFVNCENLWIQKYGNDAASVADQQPVEDGSTALLCYVLNEDLYIANVGDCRAILSQAGQLLVLSTDHNTNNSDEVKRIVDLGGFIIGGRVQGKLAITRSFGDYPLKANNQKYLTAEPEIRHIPLTSETDFIVIGCDGLYDEWENEDIIQYVQKSIEQKHCAQDIAQNLVNEAIERGSTDNVSAVIIKLNKNYKKGKTKKPKKEDHYLDTTDALSDDLISRFFKKKNSPRPKGETPKKEKEETKSSTKPTHKNHQKTTKEKPEELNT